MPSQRMELKIASGRFGHAGLSIDRQHVGTFDGQPVADGAVLVKYTSVGDTDLSGVVDATDYLMVDNAFNYNQSNPSTPIAGWANGDFNYDGLINGDD